jgi:hypothetical protein
MEDKEKKTNFEKKQRKKTEGQKKTSSSPRW